MKDIYELLNDVNLDVNDIERVDLWEFEKKRIYESVCKNEKSNRRGWKRIAAAIAVICIVGVSVPVTASVLARMSGNTHANYKEEVTEELIPEATANGESVTTANNQLEGVKIEVLSVSRYKDEIDIVCKLTFEHNIDEMMKYLDDYRKTYDDIWHSKVFENSYVFVNDIDTRIETFEDYSFNPLSTRSIIHSHENNTIIQEIQVYGFDDVDEMKDYHITLGFKDLAIGNDVIKGEWKYQYDLLASAYTNKEIVKQSMKVLEGTTTATIENYSYSIDQYALTQNGVVFYGTESMVLFHSDEWYEQFSNYPHSIALVRLHITDNLGNEYLMYPSAQEGAFDILGLDDENYSPELEEILHNKYENQILDFPCEFSLYDGPAIYNEPEKHYLTEWHPNATEIRIVLQQEVTVANSKKDLESYYQNISEPRTISLVGKDK